MAKGVEAPEVFELYEEELELKKVNIEQGGQEETQLLCAYSPHLRQIQAAEVTEIFLVQEMQCTGMSFHVE